MKTKENGITLVALVIMIVLLLILASIGYTVGDSTISSAKFTQFKNELKVMQTKVNELNQENKTDDGQELTEEQKDILDIQEISDVIYNGKTEEQKAKIKNGFRYVSKNYINETFDLEGVSRDYLVNVEYRYVVFPDGFEYEGITYYMINQIYSEIYNVQYNDKNEKTGDFDVVVTKENNRCTVEISNIQYNGYVDKWQVKYKLEDSSYWETSDNLTFYLREEGKYSVKVVHGDEIDLGTKNIFIFDYVNGVNSPELLTGMTSIKFTDPTDSVEGTVVKTTASDSSWYNYETKKWANAQTVDGSMWVWIPRYAYKITYYTDENKTTISNNKTQYGSVDVKFLIGTTDNYYDENGDIKTAQRQQNSDETIDTTKDYTVHPAFTNETNINYANGGWKKELKGIWVAKFESGYATGNNTVTKPDGTAYTTDEIKAKPSSVSYTQADAWVAGMEKENGDGWAIARNWLDGEYGSTETYIKYPTFQGLTYSMNYINHNDAYNISKALTETNNIYGLNSSNADSHLMKNSEWGAVSYLSQSKYGLNGENIYVNNVNLNSSTGATTSVYAVTGCAGATADAEKVETTIDAINNRTASNIYVWTQKNGQKASSTGTIYGIYDMSGGVWERTAGLVASGNDNLTTYGSSLINAVTKASGASTTYESTPYVIVYPSDDSGITNQDTASTENYKVNTKIYGDAIRETSTAGVGQSSWYSDYSYFAGYDSPFLVRGGNFWDSTGAGLFFYHRDAGNSNYYGGFRAVLVAQ